ncbi:MAG: response regulator [Clostridia bacterium]|nr:response regulator [Clostridia bacterium]
MIKIIVVDDERLALDRFSRIVGDDERVSLQGAFTSPSEALSFVKNNKIHAAFLDIEMPGISGLELARNIKEIDPAVSIVFITAYDCYAVDAFKFHASGYLLKPIDTSDLSEQIDYLTASNGSDTEDAPNVLTVNSFGDFVCYNSDSDKTNAIRWKTIKAEELFALLIHYRGIAVPKDVLIDKLWPDADPEKSANLFRVTCTYIRNTLAEYGFKDILIRDLNKYRLDVSKIKCDYFEFEDTLNDPAAVSVSSLRDAIALYKGEYFQSMPYDWAMQKKALLESKFKQACRISGEYYADQGDYSRACEALNTVLLYDPYDNNIAVEYTKLKIKSGDNDGALHFYREFSTRLIRETGDAPQTDISDFISE